MIVATPPPAIKFNVNNLICLCGKYWLRNRDVKTMHSKRELVQEKLSINCSVFS